MSTTSRLHVVKNAIADGLLLRANIIAAKVQVASASLGADLSGTEWIVLAEAVDGRQDWALLGRLGRDESLSIPGVVQVRQSGSNETAIRATRARAVALMAEIEGLIAADPRLGGIVRVIRLASYQVGEWHEAGNRFCAIRFTLECEFGRLT